MASEEEKKLEDAVKAFPWWNCDATENHRLHFQSHWLQANLSEVEEKIKEMVSIIEEDGDSFAKRAEMYYKRRPQLLKMLDDLHRSYRCLAEKYDQTSRSHSTRLNDPFRTSSCSSKSLTSRLQPENADCINSSCAALQRTKDHYGDISTYVMQQVLLTDQPCKSTYSCSKENLPETPPTVLEREIMEKRSRVSMMWSEKEVSELIEDHLRQQAELVKRNEEKRVKIKELHSQMKKLMKSSIDLKNKDADKPKGAFFQLAKLTGCSR